MAPTKADLEVQIKELKKEIRALKKALGDCANPASRAAAAIVARDHKPRP